MIKNKVLFVGIAGTILSSATVINFNKQYGDDEFDIVYLDKDDKEVISNLSTLKSRTLVFDETKDAYVFNYDSFEDLDKVVFKNILMKAE